ncbi:FadR family transcriptional regulator [Corynebacterium sp. TA-R-1]|uniref:FadR family transcriptional regulator n=1 Tax=Corynebacterium stercoris TaxID=2943490 RepID=A0ABT1G2N4_9CORY|nr:FadR/GntR family transcriptional regulator [Corynebacterium stercoris]MCP1386972.1 FadR family transcriptional regulator [Corynebacterium stercoris]
MATARESSTEPLLASVLDKLGEEIVSGVMPEGHTFTLQELSDRFGISRTVAREAMRALEQLGFVSSSRRVGIRVLPAEHWAVFDRSVIAWRLASEAQRPAQIESLASLRTAVEPVAAGLAAEHATQEQIQRLEYLAARLMELSEQGAGNSDEFLEIDKEFHTLLLSASGNEMFAALAEPIMDLLEGRTRYGIMPDAPEMEAMRLHVDLVEAIARGDFQASESTSRKLLLDVDAFMDN